jgi:putative protease
MDREMVGTVTHYFNKIGVAVIDLKKGVAKGDMLVFEGKDGNTFQQKADSMQIDRKEIAQANAGQSIGMKVADHVTAGDKVYKTL